MNLSEIIAALESVDPQDELTLFALDNHIRALTPARMPGLDEYHCPHYTTSLDAARMLIPPGMFWTVSSECEDVPATAVLDCIKTGPGAIANAATPELALCIAALKAREAAG